MDWSLVDPDLATYENIVALGKGLNKYLAAGVIAGDTHRISSSTDGETWVQGAAALGVHAPFSIYGTPDFVLVGCDAGKVYRSTDLVTWTAVVDSVGGMYPVYGITGHGSDIIAIVGNYALVSSDQGVTWSSSYVGTGGWYEFSSVASNGTVLVAVGAIDFVGAIVTSTDGAAWTPVTSPFTLDWPVDAVVFDATHGVFIAAVGHQAATSPDGTTWTLQDTGYAADEFSGRSLSSDAGTTVLVDSEGLVISSSDGGETWTPETGGFAPSSHVRTFAADGLFFVAAGQGDGVGSPALFLAGEAAPLEQERIDGSLILSAVLSPRDVWVDGLSGTLTIFGALSDRLVFVDTLAGVLQVSGEFSSGLRFYDTLSGGLSASATLLTQGAFVEYLSGALFLRGELQVPALDSDAAVWVVNTQTRASSRYENYGFESFALIDGRYYGCRSDGIYALDGETDAGQPVQAMVSFGKQDFGTSALKRVTNIYVGTSSGGKLFVKVLVEGEEYLYQARDGAEELQVQRFDLGRGLRANYLEFELYNADGDDFDLTSVEFAAVPLSRRI